MIFYDVGGRMDQTMNIAIVDDEPSETEALKQYLREYNALYHIETVIHEFLSGEEILADYRSFRYTLIFMDIYMNGRTGIETAKSIRETDPDATLIFLTSSRAHMSEAFLLHAYDYIEKPVDKSRVFRVMDDILKQKTELSNTPYLRILSGGIPCDISYNELLFVKSAGNYQEIGDAEGNIYKTRANFSSLSKELSSDGRFLLLIRGILVNMTYIMRFKDGTCCLKGGTTMPVNMRNKQNLEQIWKNFTFNRIRKEQERGKNL